MIIIMNEMRFNIKSFVVNLSTVKQSVVNIIIKEGNK